MCVNIFLSVNIMIGINKVDVSAVIHHLGILVVVVSDLKCRL